MYKQSVTSGQNCPSCTSSWVDLPHVWMLTSTCNLLNYLQSNSINKVNLNLEQTVSCSVMSVAFYYVTLSVKLPLYTP